MTCPSENELLELSANALAPAEAAVVSAHVATCAACSALLADVSTQRQPGRTPTTRRERARRRAKQAAPVDPLIGAQLGEYRVLERIGEGGMGVVYRGEQPVLGKPVAIKVVRPDIAEEDPELVRRLLAEARAANAIGHHGIINIFSFGTTPAGQPYFVMEHLTGQPLNEYLREHGRLPQAEVLKLFADLMGALASAHAAGVVHRDLKPSNLFLVRQADGSRFLKLLDFGLAKSRDTSSPKTQHGTVLGTPGYMAPEQIRSEPVGPATDLYAIGVVLFQLLTGRLPFEAERTAVLIALQLEKLPVAPSSLAPGIDARLDALVLKLLEKKPERRPASADVVRAELQATLERVAPPAPTSDSAKTDPAGRVLAPPADTALSALSEFVERANSLASPKLETEAARLVLRVTPAVGVVVFFCDPKGRPQPHVLVQRPGTPARVRVSTAALQRALDRSQEERFVTDDGGGALAVPIVRGKSVLGAFYCWGARFGDDDAVRVKALAAHLAAKLGVAPQPRPDHHLAGYRVALGGVDEAPHIWQVTADTLRRMTGADDAEVWVPGADGRWRVGAMSTRFVGAYVPASSGVIQRVRAQRRAVWSDDATVDASFVGDKNVVDHGVRSVAAVPALDADQVMAVLYCQSRTKPRVFTAGHRPLLEQLAADLSAVLREVRAR